MPERRTEDRGSFRVLGAREHNLKDVDVEFPVGKLVCVTGVSGSGKSTLVNEIVFKALANRLNRTRTKPGGHDRVEGIDCFDKVIEIDQAPIGRTPRSNPATYTDLFTHVRELYSLTPEAKVRGYKPGRFSFNVRGGRCETCKGDGQIKIEMHFLPDVYVPCETCHGRRYNRETLEVRFKGKSIADVLEMSVEEALEFFSKIPKIRRRLQTLHDVGLDYIRLGQPATTLSGGEAQRVKLAAELSKVATGRTLYILDEPTTGLHFADIEKLLEVLQRLVDAGNTVLVIEHNLDVIKQADWIVDLGPEGGEAGGEVIASGTPEQIADVAESYTGQFLRAGARGACRRRGVAARTTGRERPAMLVAWRSRASPSGSPRCVSFGPIRGFGGRSSRGAASTPPSGRRSSPWPSSRSPRTAPAPSGWCCSPGWCRARSLRHSSRSLAIARRVSGSSWPPTSYGLWRASEPRWLCSSTRRRSWSTSSRCSPRCRSRRTGRATLRSRRFLLERRASWQRRTSPR